MENGHSWRLLRFPEIIDKCGMNDIKRCFGVYVNQNNNSPILWLFFSRSGSDFYSRKVLVAGTFFTFAI
jgi:hypothetical protein